MAALSKVTSSIKWNVQGNLQKPWFLGSMSFHHHSAQNLRNFLKINKTKKINKLKGINKPFQK